MVFLQLIVLVLLLANTSLCLNRNCVSHPVNMEAQLRNDLFCTYDKSVVPTRAWNSTVGVTSRVFLKAFSFDDRKSKLNALVKLSVAWRDDFLVWNSSQYDGIQSLKIDRDSMWQPQIALLYNDGRNMERIFLPSTLCQVDAGRVHCIHSFTLRINCHSDHTDWPYDTHRCTASVGPAHARIKLSMTIYPIPTRRTQDTTWQVELTDSVSQPAASRTKFTVTLKRISSGQLSFMSAPASVVMTINLLSLWLAPTSWARFWVISINVRLHLMFLMYMGWNVPANGDVVPTIIRYIHTSLWITVVLLVVTLANRALSQCSQTFPSWTETAANPIRKLCTVRWLCGSDYLNSLGRGNASEGTNTVTTSHGGLLANWIDRLVFVCLLIVYVTMIICYLPVSVSEQNTYLNSKFNN